MKFTRHQTITTSNKSLFLLLLFAFTQFQLSAATFSFYEQKPFNDQSLQGCANPSYPLIEEKYESSLIDADKIDIQSNGTIFLKGDVLIGFTGGKMNASSATYVQNQNYVKDIQNGNINNSGNSFKFLTGSIEQDSGNLGLIDGKAYLRERNLLINFQSLDGNLEQNLEFKNTSLSSCSNTSEGWEIRANKILINNQSERGYIHNLTLKALGKTILKLPYLPFPATTKRLSGFLEPELNLGSDGVDLYTPYFWVISNESDLTIAPRVLKDRGVGFETNYRYLTKSNSKNFFDLLFFPKDKKFRKQYDLDDHDRWAFRLKEKRSLSKISTSIDWAKSSDSMVLLDLPSSHTSIANQRDHYLLQSISANILLENFSASIMRQGFQSLNPFIANGYIKKPEVNIEYKKYTHSLSYFAKANYADFDINRNKYLPPNTLKNNQTGKRLITEIGAETTYALSYFDLSINGLLINKKYNLDDSKTPHKTTSIPSIEVKISSLLKQPSQQSLAILVPEIVYQKTNYINQSMDPIFDLHQSNFGNLNRLNTRYFFGKDRVPDTEFVLARLKWQKKISHDARLNIQLIKKNELESSKVINEMLNNTFEKDNQIGTNIYFDNQIIRTYIEANFSQKRNELNFGKTGIEIKLPETRLSFSRNFQTNIPLLNYKNEIDFAEFSIEKLISNGYKLIGGLSKDLDSNKNLETYFGFSFENCCLTFKVYASDKRLSDYNLLEYQAQQFNNNADWKKMIEVENKSRINFEFELKGLTGINKRVNSFFSNTFSNL